MLGVCIPWQDAHVRSGRADRKRWAEHIDYCEVLGPAIIEAVNLEPTIVAGDFNEGASGTATEVLKARGFVDALQIRLNDIGEAIHSSVVSPEQLAPASAGTSQWP